MIGVFSLNFNTKGGVVVIKSRAWLHDIEYLFVNVRKLLFLKHHWVLRDMYHLSGYMICNVNIFNWILNFGIWFETRWRQSWSFHETRLVQVLKKKKTRYTCVVFTSFERVNVWQICMYFDKARQNGLPFCRRHFQIHFLNINRYILIHT